MRANRTIAQRIINAGPLIPSNEPIKAIDDVFAHIFVGWTRESRERQLWKARYRSTGSKIVSMEIRMRHSSAWDKCSPQSNCSLNFHQHFSTRKRKILQTFFLRCAAPKTDGEENYWSIKNPIFLFCQFVSVTSDWHWELQWTKRKKARLKWESERGWGGEQVTAIGWITHEWAHHI